MSLQSIISSTIAYLIGLPKRKLVEVIDVLRKRYVALSEQHDDLLEKYKKLEAENEALKSAQMKAKEKEVNLQSNKPSSKQAEWEEKGVGNDGNGKKKRRGRKGRKGAGNKPKNKSVTRTERSKVEKCGNCGRDLSSHAPLQSKNTRIIEDIPDSPLELEVIAVIQEKKYCDNCQSVTTASSTLALPNSDIGLNTTIKVVYLWITMCMPFTRISNYLKVFFGQSLSTAGLSSHVIKVSGIMKAVYEEILVDLKNSNIIHADETGWRVNGKKWWLWVIGNEDAAYYTIDKSRGKDVVRKMLGEIFLGVLVVDGSTRIKYEHDIIV